jgi:hypothetical protein
MELKPGSRWKSAVCDTEVVVVRSPKTDVGLECGGYPMIPHAENREPGRLPAKGFDVGTAVGKRFADGETGLEILCTKAGAGTVTIGGRMINTKETKKLPSSD